MNPWRVPVTIVLIVTSLLVFALMNLWNEERVLHWLRIANYVEPALFEFRMGQTWRIITPIFVHFSLGHIAFNLTFTWVFGTMIETKHGSIWLLMLVLISGAISNLVQYWFAGPFFGGMSGVVYALFGYVWIQQLTNSKFDIKLPPGFIPSIFILLIVGYIVTWTGLLEKYFGFGIANTAHLVGLVSGVVMSFLVTYLFRRRSNQY